MSVANVIIRTYCSAERRDGLMRAIQSLASQTVEIHPIIVINGQRCDSELAMTIRADIRNTVLNVTGRLPEANRAGRHAVKSEYFGFLDDDDFLLPHAIESRVSAMAGGADLVVSNGYDEREGRRVLHISDLNLARRDPCAALSTSNWLANCAGLYRSSSFPVSFFDGIPHEFEWTWLAYKAIASGKTIRFLDEPDYVYVEAAGSMSRSPEFIDAEVALYDKLLHFKLSAGQRRLIRAKQGQVLHWAADRARVKGLIGKAWRHHIASLWRPGGLKYLPYTRKLLLL